MPDVTIPAVSITVAASKIFTYPTRLADCWTPAIQEIHIPAHQVTRAEIPIHVREASTCLLAIRQKTFAKAVYNKLLRPIRIDDGHIYDARYETDANIAHILDNVASAVLAIRRSCPKITVVLRARASQMAKKAYGLLNIPVLCTDAQVIGKLIVLKGPGRSQFFGDGMYSSLFDDMSFEGYQQTTPERVFISRRGTRTLVNETEVEETLTGYNFTKVYFEDLPLSVQWSTGRNAKMIVGIHGAGLFSGLLFNRNTAKVVELFHPGYVVNTYRNLTNAIGGTWCGVTGQLPPDIVRRLDYDGDSRYFASQATRIDVAALKLALETVGII
jgi:hypothetical protein